MLSGSSLYYFETPADQKPKGVIEVGHDCLVQTADEYVTDSTFSFGLFHPGGKIFFLCAESDEDRLAWIAAFNKALNN